MTNQAIPRSRSAWLACLAIAVLTLATFARALPFPLQLSWDDGRFITKNPDLRAIDLAALRRIFSEVQFEAYHPLHLLSYWLDVPWAGPNPFVIHAVSLGLWIVALCLCYALLRAHQIAILPALIGVLAIGLHPVQVEAVSWASGRKDVLALLLSAASLLAQARANSDWDRAAIAARICYVLALLAKTSALPLPLFALCLDVFGRQVPWGRALLRQLPSLLLSVAVAVFVVRLWGEHEMLRSTLGGPAHALLRFTQTLGHLLSTATWPAHTSPMYATQSILQLDFGRTLALAAYVVVCIVAGQQKGLIWAGLLGFAMLALPVSNLLPMYFPLQDRYLSLPLLGLGFSLAAALDIAITEPATGAAAARRDAKTPVRLVFGILAVIALAARTLQYEANWQDELHLWGHAATTQPDSDYAWLKLGEVRRDAGLREGAIFAYRMAVRVAPQRKLTHAALFEAVALRDEQHLHVADSRARELAQRYYQALDQPEVLSFLAQELLAAGYVRAAELPLQLWLLRDPMPDNALEQVAVANLRAGRVSLARFYLRAQRVPTKSEPLRHVLSEPYFEVLP